MSGIKDIFSYQRPQNTWTLDQFIACQSDTTICYNNLSFINEYNNIKFPVHNAVSDYLDELRENYSIRVKLDQDQMIKYKYRPKLLCYDVYGETELYFIILLINDMCNVKDFDKEILLLPTKENMKELTTRIYNANKRDIDEYNEKNKQ